MKLKTLPKNKPVQGGNKKIFFILMAFTSDRDTFPEFNLIVPTNGTMYEKKLIWLPGISKREEIGKKVNAATAE